ncbi:unnamed protein product, partial [Durusdinium trenchii]
GDSLPGFPSPDTFEFLALPHLQKLAIPSVECVHDISSALDVLAQRMAHAVFRRFPKMAEAVLTMTQNIIQEQKDEARRIVEEQDPEYLTQHGSMEPMYKNQQPAKPAPPVEEEKPKEPGMAEKTLNQVKDGSRAAYQSVSTFLKKDTASERRQPRYSGPFVQEIRKRLDSYFEVTVRSVRDSVPKAIGFYLVRAVQEKLQFELLSALNKPDKLSEMLGEPPHIMEERRTLHNQLQVLQKASAVLTRDPTLAAIAFEAEEEEPLPPTKPAQPKATPAYAQPSPAVPAVSKAPVVSTATVSATPAARPAVTAAPKPASVFGGTPAPTGRNPLFDDAKPQQKNLFD